MSLLFETVCVKNGIPLHLAWHEKRMNFARQEIWQISTPVILESALVVPLESATGVLRCNIHYGPEIQHVGFHAYEKNIIRSLKLINCPEIDYHLKYTDRELLESLFALRGLCDEVIIVKNGHITDTTISNLIFFDGTDWFTPANPLLKGTCRNRLLATGRVIEKDIHVEDINTFAGCKLINAMRDPDEEMMIHVTEII
ncbi:MAG: aminotransferase class IV family protein [Bacteroidota bacterium]